MGEFGVFVDLGTIVDADLAEAARVAEDLGFGAFWLGGSPLLPTLRPMLAATDRLILATGIVNVWQYEPEQLAREFVSLHDAFPGRVLLGVGIGHVEDRSDYAHPVSKMRDFLDGLDSAPRPVPQDHRCLAALGPRMLDLSAERSLGTHPYFTPVEHTRAARKRVGYQALVAPALACALDSDHERGLATARGHAAEYLAYRNYASNLLRSGFDERDLVDGGSERLIDAVVPHGSAARIANVAREHLMAGADHICLQAIGVQGIPRVEWAVLAAELVL